MERFESVIDDVKDITIDIVTNGYNDMIPGMCEHLDISATRIGEEEEHFYRFTGPGVEKFYENFYRNRPDAKIIMNNEKLREENKQLKEMIEKLEQEKSNLPGQHITNPILVDNYNMMLDDNEKLKEKNKSLKDNYKMLGKAFDKVNRLLKYRDEQLENLKKEFSLEKDVNEAQHNNTRADILDQAKKCVCGQREQDYGTPESNFQLIADLWNGYLGFLDNPQWQQIRATDVAMMMALLKIARIRNGGGSGDSFVDLAGYAACGGEIWDGERHKDK